MSGRIGSKVLGCLADAKHSALTYLTSILDQRSQRHEDFALCDSSPAVVNLALTLPYMSANITTADGTRISKVQIGTL